MNGVDVRSIVLVLIALLAVGAAASTLDAGQGSSSTPEPPTGPEQPEQPGLPPGDGPRLDGIGIDWPSVSCPAALTDWPTLGALVFGLLAVGGAVYRVRRSPFVPIAVVSPVVVGVVSLCGTAAWARNPLFTFSGVGILSTQVLLGLLLATVGVVAGVLYAVTGTDERLDPGSAEEEPDIDLAAVGEAAGAAADRIQQQADVTNEVYRAWKEMTAHLDVPTPESTTPSEFADAATEAGMEPRHVGELTRLFEEVRYGDKDPDAREEQAVSALRRIEREYGGDPE